MPSALEKVRNTTSRDVVPRSGRAVGPAELLIGLVAQDQRARFREDSLDGALGERGPGGIVGGIDHDDPGPLLHRGLDQRVHVELELRPERRRGGTAHRAHW